MVKGRFARLILEGVKCTTIRLGRVIPKCSEVIIHSNGRPIAEAKIKNVIYKKVKELTEEDAKKDGYSSLHELLDDLKRIYRREVGSEDDVTIIEFEVVKNLSDIDVNDVYLGFAPTTIALLASRYLKNMLTDEEKAVTEGILRYKSIRATTIRLYGSLERRWFIRKLLRRLLVKLIDKEVIKVDNETLEKLAAVSGFWRQYLVQRKNRDGEKI